MYKHNFFCYPIIILSLVLITLFSCNFNSDEIPFPEKELGYTQPVTIPLKFSAEKKLNWDTASRGAVKPGIKKLDIDALPSTVYDSTGFRPLKGTPSETKFDFNQLPDTAFNNSRVNIS